MTDTSAFPNAEQLQPILDTIPAMLLVVDGDVRIQFLNAAAREGLHLDPAIALGERGGDALHCVQAIAQEEGCGHGAACASCSIRNSVSLVLDGGAIHRKAACLELADGERSLPVHILVSAGLLSREKGDRVLLTLENVEELTRLRNLMPICRYCGATRNDPDYRSEVAAYCEAHQGLDFPQGLCPECAGKLRPGQG